MVNLGGFTEAENHIADLCQEDSNLYTLWHSSASRITKTNLVTILQTGTKVSIIMSMDDLRTAYSSRLLLDYLVTVTSFTCRFLVELVNLINLSNPVYT